MADLRYFCVVALACSSPAATITVTTGGESGALTDAPAVTSVMFTAVDETGASVTLAQSTLPMTTDINLGDPSQEEVVSIQLTGTSATGPVVFGATPFAELGALSGTSIPLFVQRKGELARMPGAFPDARATPLLATTNRAIYVVGGTISGSQTTPPIGAYDLLLLDQIPDTWAPPQSATSFALVELTEEDADGDLALGVFIDAQSASVIGLATQILECSDDPTVSPTACTKTGTVTWSTVAGGATVMGPDGTAYVVGASKTDTPSGSIVMLPPTIFSTGSLATATFSPRQGAAVAWAPSGGVFIYGGSSNPETSGVEIISATLTPIFNGYQPDGAMGLAAVAFDANDMLIAGDAAQPRIINLLCDANCMPAPWGSALPYALSSPSLFAIGTATFVIVGDDSTGMTHMFELTASATTEIPLKIQRQGARATQTLTGAIVIVGGGCATCATPESFVP